MNRLGLLVAFGFTIAATTARIAASDPPALAAGRAIREAVIEEMSPHVEWLLGGRPFVLSPVVVRRVDDFAHVCAVATRPDGSALDLADLPGPVGTARPPLTISALLRLRGGRWLLLAARHESLSPPGPNEDLLRLDPPAGLGPVDCPHHQNWGSDAPRR